MPPAPPSLRWRDDGTCVVDGVELVHSFEASTDPTRLAVRKDRRLLERFAALAAEVGGGTIVELGIAQGGSLALLALVAAPRRVVALDVAPTPVPALEQLVERRGLGEVVRPHWGVDQGDRPRVAAIVDDEVGGRPLDLVVDDASHLLGPTTASFEVLFPRLAPGGRYVIEDWSWQHRLGRGLPAAWAGPAGEAFGEVLADRLERDPATRARLAGWLAGRGEPDGDPGVDPGGAADAPSAAARLEPEEEPLAALVVDLVLARAAGAAGIAEVTVDEHWVTVVRDDRPLEPDGYRVAPDEDPYRLRWHPWLR